MKKTGFSALKALWRNTICILLMSSMTVLLYARDVSSPVEAGAESVPLFLSVTGQITAQTDGMPLAGASVMEKGTTNGVVADFDGNYSIEVSGPDAVLVVSYVGFKTTEVTVDGQEVINIVLQEDLAQLDEVVVVGYGEQKRETITGSVATIQSKDLAKSPTVNVSNAIAGRMPGVIATQDSGEPGADDSNIRIRGSNSFGDSSPLVVIDGIPAREGGFSRLNPADIENISVLKDASAAIYGARAANGVILVTTKRGSDGKPRLSYNYNLGFSQPTVIPDVANATQYAEMRNDLEVYKLPVSEWQSATTAFQQSGTYTRPNGNTVTAPFMPDDFQKFRDGSDPWGHPDTDWFDATFKDWSKQERHNIQLTGGNENMKFLTSLGYQKQDAYYKNSATNYEQYDIRINLDAKINEYITTQIGVLGRQEDRNYPTKAASAIFRMLMRGNPTQPAFWPNGMPGPDIEYGENPVVITTNQTGYDRDRRYYFQTNGKVEIKIPWVEGLKFTGTAAIDKYIQQKKRWETPWYLYTWQGEYEEDGETPKLVAGKRGPAEPNLRQENQDQLNILLGGVLTYDRKFGDHELNFLAGVNRETIRNDNFFAFRRYFISTVIDQMFAGGAAERNNGGDAWERARLNYFGRVGYNYKEKYLAEFLWRYDGSYMFPQDSRYGFFPGVMLGWRISEENFWKDNVEFVNYLKLRASWGQMGNDNIYFDANGDGEQTLQEYQYYSTYGFGSYIVDGNVTSSLLESRVPNTMITWEEANNYNIGLDGQLFNGRVNFELDMFLNKRSSILWRRNASVPQTTGMTLPAENIGKLENRGWEFNIGYNGTAGEVQYNVSVNGGYAKNKIKFWDEAPGAPEWQRSTGSAIDAGLYYLYDGVFLDEEEIANNTLDYSDITNTLRPGDMKYKDYDGDGRITPDDRVRRDRNNQPTFQGGLNLGAQYKDFDLSILFQGAAGGELRVGTDESGAIGNYLHDFYENRWTVDNPSSVHPRITDRSDQYYSFDNTYWLRSTNYIRLKNVELGYNLPAEVGDKIGVSNLRIYLSGLNLATWSKIKVLDPESVNSIGHYYPQSRIVNMGVSVTF
ncbi:SusC/RagA family TonB-linked outer membrane protein [Sinomicrobium sp. M5D2P9]